MPDRASFLRNLASAPTISLEKIWVRIVPRAWLEAKAPPDFLFTSGKPNRYNPGGVQCVYFSEDEATALLEYLSLWSGTGGEHQPRTTYFARVQLEHALDLRDARTLAVLGLKARDLYQPWRLATAPTVTQVLGQVISDQQIICAIRFPSVSAHVAGPEGANVVIFRDSIRHPSRVEILGPGKVPLQTW
jgi:RES domain-containing protein